MSAGRLQLGGTEMILLDFSSFLKGFSVFQLDTGREQMKRVRPV